MKTKTVGHTPGPWECLRLIENEEENGTGENYTAGWAIESKEIKGWHLARIDPQGEHEANARLIAASPELLAVVRALVGASRYVDGTNETEPATAQHIIISSWAIGKARSVLAKAEGREG